ncbi:MAG: HlyD family efflux transporter periplasmic adaptor subunit, partial [Planctomycetaceae bacterium]|nr:HlyD family efflux transporter periplasmic adaptor subunit [Planctomycetaceae bacterium]
EKPPETHTVAPGPFQVQVDLDGIFESEQMTEIILRPDVFTSLTVEKSVPQGTKVAAGETVLWLETEDIDEQLKNTEFDLEQAKLSLALAQLELAVAEASAPLDLRAAERTKAEADLAMDHYLKVDADMAVRSAQESLKASEYSLEYTQEELSQLEQMYKADDLTEQTEEIILKRARRDVEQGQYFLELARIRHDRTLNETLPRQKEEMQDATNRAALALQRAQATIPSDVEGKRIALQKQKFAHEQQLHEFEKLKADRVLFAVKAPVAGIVYYGQCERGRWTTADSLARQLRPGGNVSANQVIMTIVAPGPGFVRTDVPEASLRFMTPGASATIVPTAFPRMKIAAKVAAVDPIPVSEGTFDGKVAIVGELGGASIVPGMRCAIKVSAYSRTDALAVPSSAVFSEDDDKDLKYVYVVVTDAEPRKQSVQVGEASGERTEILSGLAAGDQILLKKPE